MSQKIAIIGSGLSGSVLAYYLQKSASVSLFEKSQGVSGRMSTRSFADFEFDHGAQFFTARSNKFNEFLLPYLEGRTVVEWKPKILTLEKGKDPFKRLWYEPHYIAQPKMTSLCKAIASPKDIKFRTRIDRIFQKNDRWSLVSGDEIVGEGYSWVISATPAIQTRELFDASGISLNGLSEVKYSPCFSLMVGLSSPVQLNFDAALVKNSPIKWIAVNSSKVGRSTHKTLVIHSSNSWAQDNLERELSYVQDQLLDELISLINLTEVDINHIDLARWRYAKVSKASNQDVCLNSSLKVAACGDWCLGSRVEDAFLSAVDLYEALTKSLKADDRL